MVENWIEQKRPMRLERRIEFDNYDLTREFLDLTAELSEKEGFYPDMNFGRTHVSMTIHADNDGASIEEVKVRFAQLINKYVPTNQVHKSLHANYEIEGVQ